jgi:hypothetical protein
MNPISTTTISSLRKTQSTKLIENPIRTIEGEILTLLETRQILAVDFGVFRRRSAGRGGMVAFGVQLLDV